MIVNLLCGGGEREEGTQFIVIDTALYGVLIMIYFTAQKECRVLNFLLFLPASFSCEVLGVVAVFTFITLLLLLENNIDDSGINNNYL